MKTGWVIMGAMRVTVDRRRSALLGVAAVAVVLAASGIALLSDDDGEDVTSDEQQMTTEAPTTTGPSTTVTFAPTVDPAMPIWPLVDTSRRFDDPMAATHSFAVDLVGFREPVIGELRPGTAGTGQIQIQPHTEGPLTTVVVGQIGDGSWWVLRADGADISLGQPATGQQIECPVTVSGFTVEAGSDLDATVWADGFDKPIGTGSVEPPDRFGARIDCSLDGLGASPQYGTFLLTARDTDGSVQQVAARRVKLA
jgi:hypothetical protein